MKNEVRTDSKGNKFVDIFVGKERYMRISETPTLHGEKSFSIRVYKHSAKDNSLHVGVYVPEVAVGDLVSAMLSLKGETHGSN